MLRAIILLLALSVLWLLLSGYFDNLQLLAFGAASVVLCVVLAWRARVLDEEGVPAAIMPGVFVYLLWLAVEVGKANIVVAREALAVKPRLSPKLVKAAIPTRTNAGLATFANSITLTPGTVSIDLEPDYILVHALTEQLADEDAIADMGRRVAAVEHGAKR